VELEMGYQSQFMTALFYQGQESTITVTSGTDCPCLLKYGTYDPQWHVDNPLAEDCNGTGQIESQETEYTIKSVFCGIVGLQQFILQIKATEIGQLTKDDVLMIGTVDTSDMSFINLKTLVTDFDNAKYQIVITHNSTDWLIEHVYDIQADELVCQVAVLTRKPNA
jgi:hypothetical protein